MKYLSILVPPLALAAMVLSPAAGSAQSEPTPLPSNATAPPARTLPTDLSGATYKARPIPQVEVPTPFATSPPLLEKTDPLTFLSADQMSAADRALVSSTDTKIRETATLAGMELAVGRWDYQQLVCKALPGHVFLIYESENGPGDSSLFSAAIPRGGQGRVHVIPIERRGFSLFSPAPVNALTLAAFNRIRADEPENKSADWLATALCYAALAGARPAVSAVGKDASAGAMPLIFPPTLEVGNLGDATVRFVDVAKAQPTEWALTFSPNGQLLTVDHFATPSYAITPIPPK
jgi:hypothetical protein